MTEKDTLQDERKEGEDNEVLIAEMLRDAKDTEIPSDLKENPVIHKGDADLPVPMTVQKMKDAGYKSIWDTRTYRWAPVLEYMLTQKLRERRPDGSFIWTTNNPHQPPIGGKMKCLLHKDSPNRKEYDDMGLRTCKKSNIPNDFEVTQHMALKHPKEWKAIEAKRIKGERLEDRELQRALITKVAEKEKPPVYVSDKDKKK